MCKVNEWNIEKARLGFTQRGWLHSKEGRNFGGFRCNVVTCSSSGSESAGWLHVTYWRVVDVVRTLIVRRVRLGFEWSEIKKIHNWDLENLHVGVVKCNKIPITLSPTWLLLEFFTFCGPYAAYRPYRPPPFLPDHPAAVSVAVFRCLGFSAPPAPATVVALTAAAKATPPQQQEVRGRSNPRTLGPRTSTGRIAPPEAVTPSSQRPAAPNRPLAQTAYRRRCRHLRRCQQYFSRVDRKINYPAVVTALVVALRRFNGAAKTHSILMCSLHSFCVYSLLHIFICLRFRIIYILHVVCLFSFTLQAVHFFTIFSAVGMAIIVVFYISMESSFNELSNDECLIWSYLNNRYKICYCSIIFLIFYIFLDFKRL